MPIITPQYELKIGSHSKVALVKRIKITSSWQIPCDTAEIEFPMLKVINLDTFKENEDVEIKLGNLDLGLETVFTGQTAEIGPKLPLVLKCEDYFRKAKEVRYTETYKDKFYSEIAKDAIGRAGLEANVPQEGLPPKIKSFRVDKHTVAEVLEKLHDRGWVYFVEPGTKKCYYGPICPYAQGILPQPHNLIFRFGLNIIESNLEYRTHKIKKLTVNFIDREFRELGVTGTYESGDEKGTEEVINLEESFHADKGQAQKDANTRAKEEWAKKSTSGYEGSFKTFGNPRLRHSYKITMNDPDHPMCSGPAWVNQVVYEFGMDVGFKMDIELAPSVAGG